MIKGLLGEERFNKSKKYYQTNNRELFTRIDSDKKYFGKLAKFHAKSFAFVYLRPVDFVDAPALMKARSICTKGILFNSNSISPQLERIIFKFSEIKRSNKKFDEIRAINDDLKDTYKAEKKRIKGINKDTKEANKELEKTWKDSKKVLKKGFEKTLEDMNDEQKKYMPKEPEYEPEPTYGVILAEPKEPNYRDEPRSVSIHIGENQLYKTFYLGWHILSHFEFFIIEGTSHGILIKRKEQLKYTYDNLEKLSIDNTISRDDFLKFFDKNERNEKVLESYRPEVATDYNALDLYAESDALFKDKDWVFEEQISEDDGMMLPALAPIKPMHAASILSAGMKFSKEIQTEEGLLLIKSAPVKTFTEKVKIVNGRRITEVYQQQETKLAFYNQDRRELEVY